MKIPTISSNDSKQEGQDTAAILPLTQLRFSPPSISSGDNVFTWPLGVEGFRRFGSQTLGIHKYLGAGNVAVQVTHLDEAHIEMSGTFPGLTAKNSMAELLAVITADGPKNLIVPGVLQRIQHVYTENYDFSHPADDRTHSIDYTLSFVRSTTGGNAPSGERVFTAVSAQIAGASSLPNTPRSSMLSTTAQSDRVITVTDGARTLREIAAIVYGDQTLWPQLVDINRSVIETYNPDIALGIYQLPTLRLPIGMNLIY